MKKAYDVIIIGAGVAGLVCAYELEKHNLKPLILESSDDVGGRVKTSHVDGWPLDHGFQVLLTAYPEAQHYLDYKALDLKYFNPGAIIYDGKGKTTIGDPLRQPNVLFSTLFSSFGSLSDKLKIAQLGLMVKKKSIEEIFEIPDQSTQDFLIEYGFSERIISNFFRPFFGGIFLENELSTSARMFQFVFKMFAEGRAAIPGKGIGEIPLQLKNKLQHTEIRLNTSVKKVDTAVHVDSGETLTADNIVIATQPDALVKGLDEHPQYQSVTNMYFLTNASVLNTPTIGLVATQGMMINNFHEGSQLLKNPDSSQKLLSVSVNGKGDVDPEAIRLELAQITGIDASQLKHLQSFTIAQALPVVNDLKNDMQHTAVKLNDNIFLAGDYLLNGSLNAAMKSGRLAAQAVIASR